MNKNNHNLSKKEENKSSSALTGNEQEQVRQFEESFRRLPTLATAWLNERKGKITPALASAVATKICKGAQPDDKKMAIFSQFGPLGLWKELEKANISPYAIVGRHWMAGLPNFLRLGEQQELSLPTMRVIYPYANNRVFMDRWITIGGDINAQVDGKNLLSLFVEKSIKSSDFNISEIINFANWFASKKGKLIVNNINNIYSLPLSCVRPYDKPNFNISSWWKVLNEFGGDINKDPKVVKNVTSYCPHPLPMFKIAFEVGFLPNSFQFEKIDFISAISDPKIAAETEEFIHQAREEKIPNKGVKINS